MLQLAVCRLSRKERSLVSIRGSYASGSAFTLLGARAVPSFGEDVAKELDTWFVKFALLRIDGQASVGFDLALGRV